MTTFVDEYVRYAKPICHAPELFHRMSALNCLSAALGSNVCMRWGDGWIYPNLWVLLLADSGISAKTTAMNIGMSLLQDVDGIKLFPDEFSYEGLVGLLETHSCGVFAISEFSQWMGQMRRNYNDGALGLLTKIYDVPDVHDRTLKSGHVRLR
ncbi:MAG: DUF3987 domain-containing protein, partial [Gammaproteobacteria bacterium]|nr:DUF3987 domain-containing protein [Gammaproteobacteria bacterium]